MDDSAGKPPPLDPLQMRLFRPGQHQTFFSNFIITLAAPMTMK
jgi:hypothetical protein